MAMTSSVRSKQKPPQGRPRGAAKGPAGSERAEASLNRAFMFLKPHANTEAGRGFLREQLERRGIAVNREGEVGTGAAEALEIVDAHYGSLAAKALHQAPGELALGLEALAAFRGAFGLRWEEALAAGRVCNAMEAMGRLGCDAAALEALWAPLRFGEGKVKLGSGCYCGRVGDLFVINGFYLTMRGMYTRPGSAVHWYTVSFPAASRSWGEFRRRDLGHTDPALAHPESLRGLFLRRWRELGLAREPHVGENALHASASPLEALKERVNWLRLSLRDDIFFQQLTSAGVTLSEVQRWLKDPLLRHGDGPPTSAFDLFEDKDTRECLQLAEALAGRAGV